MVIFLKIKTHKIKVEVVIFNRRMDTNAFWLTEIEYYIGYHGILNVHDLLNIKATKNFW